VSLAEWVILGLVTAVLIVAGATLIIGGVMLIAAGGSFYYLLAGAAALASAIALILKHRSALPIFGLLLAATVLWSLWEVGLDGWALVPRLVAPAVLGLIMLIPAVRRRSAPASGWWIGIPVIAVVTVIGGSAVQAAILAPELPPATVLQMPDADQGEWHHWGRTLGGTRFSPLNQINTENVAKLQLAWTFRSDVPPFGYHSFEATPLAANGKLYLCLDRNVIVALDQETGEPIWRFDPQTRLDGVFAATCRGVAYHEATDPLDECQRRVLFGTHENRLMAVDAESGQPCRSFGNAGVVDLNEGLGEVQPGITFPTSPPTIVNGLAIIGGWVTDGLRVGEPSGVVRAYDAVTGALRWAWDAGRPDPQAPLGPGETYTPGAPNAWGVFSADEALGLVYVPTGVSTPDYFGAHRTPEAEKYSNSIVALEIETGSPRWSFQVVHHDLWDYDIASQPVLVDLPMGRERIPALIAPTKRGQFFVLDRRDGRPIYPVKEMPAPQGTVDGEWTAETQPYSTFPNVAGGKLAETRMWGVTPIDQLWCRIQFRRARYEGEFTPPGLEKTIFYPGSAGGVNWGSVTVDTARDLMVTNSLYMPDVGWLIPRSEAANLKPSRSSAHADSFAYPQEGTPYAMRRMVFLNPLGVPCLQPPYGRISVIDLKTGSFLWSRVLGTAYRAGPLGFESRLPIPMGVPNLGGSIATAGGLIFIGAAQDRILRAIDIGNGKELWRYSLPSVGAATPMTYLSPKSGRQFVVIAAGGHPALPGPTDSFLLAFALPDEP